MRRRRREQIEDLDVDRHFVRRTIRLRSGRETHGGRGCGRASLPSLLLCLPWPLCAYLHRATRPSRRAARCSGGRARRSAASRWRSAAASAASAAATGRRRPAEHSLRRTVHVRPRQLRHGAGRLLVSRPAVVGAWLSGRRTQPDADHERADVPARPRRRASTRWRSTTRGCSSIPSPTSSKSAGGR